MKQKLSMERLHTMNLKKLFLCCFPVLLIGAVLITLLETQSPNFWLRLPYNGAILALSTLIGLIISNIEESYTLLLRTVRYICFWKK